MSFWFGIPSHKSLYQMWCWVQRLLVLVLLNETVVEVHIFLPEFKGNSTIKSILNLGENLMDHHLSILTNTNHHIDHSILWVNKLLEMRHQPVGIESTS